MKKNKKMTRDDVEAAIFTLAVLVKLEKCKGLEGSLVYYLEANVDDICEAFDIQN